MKYVFGLFILATITLREGSTTVTTKPGCPPIDPQIRCVHFHEQCKSDSECEPGQLCCGDNCGTNCREPSPLPPPTHPNTCWLPKDKGPCKALIPRFYYDSNTYKCRKFIYGGCQGNANNFKTKRECNQECKKSVCTLPKDHGPCKGSFKKWYYNAATGKCEKFIYGGCKGNGNRFNRYRGCMKNCKGVKPTPPPSPSPPPPPPTDPGKPKPGMCPIPNGRPGICVEACGGDSNCPGYQKCCSNGCGHVCTNPAGKSKPGMCPIPNGRPGICVEACRGDSNCPGYQKCCSNGCGHVCTNPAGPSPAPSPPPPRPPFPPHSVCEKGTPFPNINCGFGSGRNPCPRGYYCKTEATDHYAVCCQNPCSYGRPHSTLSCGMMVGSNKCPNGYSCVAGAADEFFACCPTRPSPSPPPPPPPPPPFPPQSVCEKGTPFPNINCGLGPASKTCPRSYYCKTHPTDHYAVCCQNPCSYGEPHPTLSCGMVIGSNKCPTGYSCAAGAADEFFACCPTKPSPSPPPPPTLPGKSKPGSCPKPKPGTAGICLQRCNGDFDCPGNAKCCSNGCGNECSAPEDNDPKCRVGQPLSNVFCGRGPNRRDCPKGYYCNVHPTDKYAVCCRNDNVPICRVGQPLSNINCGRGLNRQNCPRGYYCNVHPTDKYAVCCRNVYMLPG